MTVAATFSTDGSPFGKQVGFDASDDTGVVRVLWAANQPSTDEPLAALRSAGMALERRARDDHGAGIVFFNQITSPLGEFVREVSRGGAERVLAVAMPSDTVARDGSPWTLLQRGASDVIVWDRSRDTAAGIASRFERWQEIDSLLESPLIRTNLIGNGREWRATLRHVVEVARFTDASVLILGESGTGKELIARLIHDWIRGRTNATWSCSTARPSCRSSPAASSLVTSAARSPVRSRHATVRSLSLTAARCSSTRLATCRWHCRRSSCARCRNARTNASAETSGTRRNSGCSVRRTTSSPTTSSARPFRADLYYRIGGVVCRVPPLRHRPEDILHLFQHFLAQTWERTDLPEIDEPVRQLLLKRPYPGNIRELQQLARRTTSRHVGTGPITIGDIPDDEWPHEADDQQDNGVTLERAIRHALSCGVGLKDISRLAAEAAIRIAIDEANGNLQIAARRLGVTDRALQIRRAAGMTVSGRSRRSRQARRAIQLTRRVSRVVGSEDPTLRNEPFVPGRGLQTRPRRLIGDAGSRQSVRASAGSVPSNADGYVLAPRGALQHGHIRQRRAGPKLQRLIAGRGAAEIVDIQLRLRCASGPLRPPDSISVASG